MDYFYDGQLRRYITQFMRIFIGFKWETIDKEQKVVPVQYGDMSRQVAALLRENSENKIIDVPKMSCYITGLEMDKKRLSDSSFVSKVNIRERRWNEVIGEDSVPTGARNYQNVQGGNYTVERLMPTPFILKMKMDLWTSNTDQKLQLMEQMLVLFNPSLEIQSTDNYLDWTSLTVVDLTNIEYSSKSIPQGVDTQLDICTMTFELPIWISPPAKVKKLGIVKSIINNVFTEQGDVLSIEDLAFNNSGNLYGAEGRGETGVFGLSSYNFAVTLLKTENTVGQDYEVTINDPTDTIIPLISQSKTPDPNNPQAPVTWQAIIEALGGFKPGSRIAFKQPGGELVGTFAINPLNPGILSVTFDIDTLPQNSSFDIIGLYRGIDGAGEIYESPGFDTNTAKQYIDFIIDPLTFNPVVKFEGNIPYNTRLLILEDIGNVNNTEPASAWGNLVASADSIIAWDGTQWVVVFDPNANIEIVPIVQNMKTLIKYRFLPNNGWVKAFEGVYESGTWTLLLED